MITSKYEIIKSGKIKVTSYATISAVAEIPFETHSMRNIKTPDRRCIEREYPKSSLDLYFT
jgi:hypothetical protein